MPFRNVSTVTHPRGTRKTRSRRENRTRALLDGLYDTTSEHRKVGGKISVLDAANSGHGRALLNR